MKKGKDLNIGDIIFLEDTLPSIKIGNRAKQDQLKYRRDDKLKSLTNEI